MVPKGAEPQAVAEVIQAMVAEIGINMKIRVTEFATSLKQAEAGEYQAYLLYWSGRSDPDGNFYSFYKCKAPLNYTAYCNPEVDKLLDESRVPSDMVPRGWDWKSRYLSCRSVSLSPRCSLSLTPAPQRRVPHRRRKSYATAPHTHHIQPSESLEVVRLFSRLHAPGPIPTTLLKARVKWL
jgi:hypothetical protein